MSHSWISDYSKGVLVWLKVLISLIIKISLGLFKSYFQQTVLRELILGNPFILISMKTTRYTSKWLKTAVTEIGSCDFKLTPNFKMAQTIKTPNFKMAYLKCEFMFGNWIWWVILKLCHFEVWGHFEVTWPYLCHSSFGPFWGIPRITIFQRCADKLPDISKPKI